MTKTIYTSFTDNYDDLKSPLIKNKDWRHICYTNKPVKCAGWEVIVDPELNSVQKVREKKIVPPFESDISIWVDASFLINCNLTEFVKENMKEDFCLMTHPDRKCVYEEAMACIKYKKDDTKVITDQVLSYRKMGYPRNMGMVATGVILRKHTEPVFDFCHLWNNDVQKMSYRDQLSFNYNQWRNGIKYHMIDFSITKKEFILQPHTHRRNG